jgi:hypothetical protein
VVQPVLPAPGAPSIDPATGRLISPIVAAALCVKPRRSLSGAQAAKVDVLKGECPDFSAMRRLATRFRGILRSKNAGKLGVWLKGARHSGLYAMRGFARTLHREIDAVRKAITERWSNGQTEGQIWRTATCRGSLPARRRDGSAPPTLCGARAAASLRLRRDGFYRTSTTCGERRIRWPWRKAMTPRPIDVDDPLAAELAAIAAAIAQNRAASTPLRCADVFTGINRS